MTNKELLETLEKVIPELESRGLIKYTYVKVLAALVSAVNKLVRNEKLGI